MVDVDKFKVKVTKMNAYANFGEFIKIKREEKQITLRKMAELLKCSAPFLSDVEKDRRNPFDMTSWSYSGSNPGTGQR